MADQPPSDSGGQTAEQGADQVIDTTTQSQPAQEQPPAEQTAEVEQPAGEAPADAPADGEQPATDQPAEGDQAAEGASPAPSEAEKPAEPPKKAPKSLIKKILPIAIGVVVVILVFGGGYFIGSKFAKPSGSSSTKEASSSAQEATDSATLANIVTPNCIGGYQPFTSPKFSICFPNTMTQQQQEASESGKATSKYVFQNDVETLTVLTDYNDTPNRPTCASSKVVKVAGYQAIRWTIKDTDAKGNCSSTVSSYQTLVSNGNDQPVFAIGLTKKSGSFQSDNGEFASIESSFLINGL